MCQLDSYPSVDERVILHVTPVGARVSGHLYEGEAATHLVRPIPVAVINSTAREILRRCDGTLTIHEIVHLLLNQSDSANSEDAAKQMLTGALEFVQQAVQYGILKLHQTPMEQPIYVTGSLESFIPQHMSVELTSGCNLRCIYCYRDSGPQMGPFLSGKQLINILEELHQSGLRSVELTGGEPLLHPQFRAVLDFCAKQLDRVALLTNGTLIDKEIARELGQRREKVLVQVDLDGPVPNVHDALRGVQGAFVRAKYAIKLLAEHGVSTRVAMNVTKDNLNYIEDTLLLAKSLGATWFIFTPMLDVGRGKNIDTVFSVEQVEYMGCLSQHFYEEHGSFFSYLKPDVFRARFEADRNCGAGQRAVVLGPTGKVRPCPLLPEEYLTIGDLTTKSVFEVFSNPVMSKLYELESPRERICGECEYALYCRYCHTRGILTQAKLESPCKWFQANELAEWVSIPVDTSIMPDKPCKTNAQCVC